MNTKVLRLHKWMMFGRMLEQCVAYDQIYAPVEPVYNRPGIYLHGNKCWFEVKDGRAWTYPKETFLREIRLLDIERLNHRQIAALSAIVQNKLATPEQRELLYYAEYLQSLRYISLNGYRSRIRLAEHKKRLTTIE